MAPVIGDKFEFGIQYTHTDMVSGTGSPPTTSAWFAVEVTVVCRPGACPAVGGGEGTQDNSITANALAQSTDVYSDTASSFSVSGPSFSTEPTSLSGGSVTYSIDTSSYLLNGAPYFELANWLSVSRNYNNANPGAADAVFTQSSPLEFFGIDYPCTITFTLKTTYTTEESAVGSGNESYSS